MKYFVAFLFSLAAVSCCFAEQNAKYIQEYRTIKEGLDNNLVNDLEVLLFYLSTWRLVRLNLNELKEGTAELVNTSPVVKEDAPILMDELKVRARELHIALDERSRPSIEAMAKELLVKPCHTYQKAFDTPLFRQVEVEDPKLESYYVDDSKMDFYTGWATLKMCNNLLKEIEHGSLIDNMMKPPLPEESFVV